MNTATTNVIQKHLNSRDEYDKRIFDNSYKIINLC